MQVLAHPLQQIGGEDIHRAIGQIQRSCRWRGRLKGHHGYDTFRLALPVGLHKGKQRENQPTLRKRVFKRCSGLMLLWGNPRLRASLLPYLVSLIVDST